MQRSLTVKLMGAVCMPWEEDNKPCNLYKKRGIFTSDMSYILVCKRLSYRQPNKEFMYPGLRCTEGHICHMGGQNPYQIAGNNSSGAPLAIWSTRHLWRHGQEKFHPDRFTQRLWKELLPSCCLHQMWPMARDTQRGKAVPVHPPLREHYESTASWEYAITLSPGHADGLGEIAVQIWPGLSRD